MVDNQFFKEIPLRRLKPVDGMAVTAQVWDEAHDYHKQHQRLHNLLMHGTGIVTGLEVIASDPADSSVYILPGMAVDRMGNLIVISEPVPYEFGSTNGLLYLVLTYAESRPEQQQDGGPLYIQAQFGIEAVSTFPEGSTLELGRIQRSRDGQITNAAVSESPKANEIDLRFRRGLVNGEIEKESVAVIGVCYADQSARLDGGHGIVALAQQLRQAGQRVYVDENVAMNGMFAQYTLVVVAAEAAFQLTREEMNGLYSYIREGGTVLLEGCLRNCAPGTSPVQGLFQDLANSFGIPVAQISTGHALLASPHLFAVPPAGFETSGASTLWVGDGLIISGNDYGCLWQGTRRDHAAAREDIRSALEWGENILHYARQRRREASRS